MLMPHPLNQAVIIQALHDLRNGQLRRCKAMGFSDSDLAALKQPALVSLLLNSQAPWCTVSVNHGVIERILRQADNTAEEVANVDRMLRLGASTEMVCAFYGLTHQEIALRRDILGLPKRKGRHPVLTEDQENELWHQWKPQVDARSIALNDDQALLTLALDLAESLGHPASVIWAAGRSWIEQQLV